MRALELFRSALVRGPLADASRNLGTNVKHRSAAKHSNLAVATAAIPQASLYTRHPTHAQQQKRHNGGQPPVPLSQACVAQQRKHAHVRRLHSRSSVCARLLLPDRHRRLVQVGHEPLRAARSRHLYRLDTRHLLRAGDASHQLDRQVAAVGRQLQLQWQRRGVEGAAGAVFGLCAAGWRPGGERRGPGHEVHCHRAHMADDLDGCRQCGCECADYAELGRALDCAKHGG